jgi:hypothetical protein
MTGNSSLATGDFNDDGVADLLIGMPFADGPDNEREDAGEAFVIFGRDGLKGEIDLAENEVGFHVLGALPGDNLGFGVASGDLNGDGIDDIIVGAPGSNGLANIRTDLGEAYVIFGHTDLGGRADMAAVEQDFTLIAAEGFARVGTSFALADVNGDGIEDLIAGAPFAGREPGTPPGGPRTSVGEVYVVFGSPNLRGRASVAEDQQDLILAGSGELDAFGQAVAAGDVNGDGTADIIVGARSFDGPEGNRRDSGAAFVFFGSSSLSGKLGVRDADLTVLGSDVGDALGEAVGVGDLNGDGVADIVAVARTGDGPENDRSSSGEAHVLLGGASVGGVLDLATGEADAAIYGPSPSGLMATALALGDLDGDGRDDITLGTPLATGKGRTRSGAAYVVFGNDLTGTIDLHWDVDGRLFVYGAAGGDGLGTGVAIGDINGDGRSEVILAAVGAQGPGERQGKIYVVSLP